MCVVTELFARLSAVLGWSVFCSTMSFSREQAKLQMIISSSFVMNKRRICFFACCAVSPTLDEEIGVYVN